VETREALRSELEFALSTRPATAWEERLHTVGVACRRVNDIGAAIEYAAQLGRDPVLRAGPTAQGSRSWPLLLIEPDHGLDGLRHGEHMRVVAASAEYLQ
jgi:crotonobetainyl-CoA:carnitine CoA-transferase CaiB-like acyl-CoA transferase